ncbi:3-hydroxyacyl-ACP dehydratase FabZ family protein [Christiangramia sp. SM2212]|uniref:3-hydroxyacyl-ACP dehydratase FabZ family protein n=1 Tax=Christiangramia sediminicola TaxID=3073267 RepID=A0ABU1EPF6_9FLAO|nr:3-hydroxyacyl-ACP dehydratase FabZ family protein [Christiangramia sp. SM2212]MDR5590279.1 3-hydroxyacyl-ACP dehydratase FabZ family protein [Christiangramia sp. SM2212]
MNKESILELLPYTSPFLFVDRILDVDEDKISGEYTFSPDLEFYKGHFKNNPVTPGVILTECMAQIGLVSLGIYLMDNSNDISGTLNVALTSSDIEYLKPVYPGEKVTVHSEKQYFRFNKLKCNVEMRDSEANLVCKGVIAGMIIKN